MGPFSNNPPQPPVAPSNGTKLPVPDVEGAPQNIIVSLEPDREGAKKWLVVTSIIVGAMTVASIIVFATYVYISNTPSYMLNAAFQNFVINDGEAGVITYQSKQGSMVNGNFLNYTDPTNLHVNTLTVSIGQDASRVSATSRFFADGNYIQTAGLGNLARLVESIGGATSTLTPDNLVRLSSLDGQWYTLLSDDILQVSDILQQHTVQNGPTSANVEMFEQLYLQHPFLTAAQQLSDEHIDSINSMHVKVTIDPIKLNAFLQSVKAANIKSLHLTDTDIQSILKSPTLSGTTLEAWIARSDRSFEQIRIAHGAQLRPDGAQSAAGFVRQLHDVLTTQPTAK